MARKNRLSVKERKMQNEAMQETETKEERRKSAAKWSNRFFIISIFIAAALPIYGIVVGAFGLFSGKNRWKQGLTLIIVSVVVISLIYLFGPTPGELKNPLPLVK